MKQHLLKGFFLVSTRSAIAATLPTAQAVEDARLLNAGLLLLVVALIPLALAVWMPAT